MNRILERERIDRANRGYFDAYSNAYNNNDLYEETHYGSQFAQGDGYAQTMQNFQNNAYQEEYYANNQAYNYNAHFNNSANAYNMYANESGQHGMPIHSNMGQSYMQVPVQNMATSEYVSNNAAANNENYTAYHSGQQTAAYVHPYMNYTTMPAGAYANGKVEKKKKARKNLKLKLTILVFMLIITAISTMVTINVLSASNSVNASEEVTPLYSEDALNYALNENGEIVQIEELPTIERTYQSNKGWFDKSL